MGTLDEGGVGSLDLAEGQGVGGIILGADQFEGGGEPFGMGDEPLIVFAWHGHIGIIVPGDETLVADGSEHRACPEVIRELVLSADLV